ncbi:hypothetical protein Dda_4325 [Drechslerella dactyloides]|uniref:Uncharacterized protein n=1 Tax=Drechslerella dactyloides TaxID=74499 RepID=A0AAD6IY29_DREDA|nr:hypothetical protein Dda_4325 [Drechslerella dactyloides]
MDHPQSQPVTENYHVTRIDFSPESTNPQPESPLFRLPGELRNQIWAYALTPYLDLTHPYPNTTCYARPDYRAPHVTAVSLLRACKAIYQEAWYLPWVTAELVFYLAWQDRRPARVETVVEAQRILNHLVANNIDTTIPRVRVFAQLCNLEDGSRLEEILTMKHFRPTEVTVTLRHTDWWNWESDAPLHAGSMWVGYCRFPESTQVIRVEFESLERKKASIDHIARQAVKKWEFRRQDGAKLTAKRGNMKVLPTKEGEEAKEYDEGEVEVMRWTGSSTWENRRWIRDEIPSEPGKLQYYVKTVVWRVDPATKPKETKPNNADSTENIPGPLSESQDGSDSDEHDGDVGSEYDDYDEDFDLNSNNTTSLHAPWELHLPRPSITSVVTWQLQAAGCDDTMNAQEVADRMTQWQQEMRPTTTSGPQGPFSYDPDDVFSFLDP